MQAELDGELVAGQPVSYDDRRRVPFVDAVVLEAMRLAPVVALALPHFTAVDVRLPAGPSTGELSIPADSIVIANLWSVGRDPDVWGADADVFRPERFLRSEHATTPSPLDDELDPGGRGSLAVDDRLTESFYPFSYGARRCVGESLGRRQIFIFFATIMRSCLLAAVDGRPAPGDAETYGDVVRPAPYQIRIMPR